LSSIDLPAKLNGSAVFGLDFSVPGMVCAAVKHSPVHGGSVATFDKSSVMNLPGVIDVVPIPNGVAVVASQYWHAQRALKMLKVTFDDGPSTSVNDANLNARYRAALDGNAWKTVKMEGEAIAAEVMRPRFASVYSQEYESQFLAHATMEPMNCTAHVTNEGCTIWGPLQGNQLAQVTLASVLNLPPEKVTINRTLLGGGFGRRLLVDFVLQAALVSRAIGKPVKVIWSREDMQHDVYRPATLQRITAGLDRTGKPAAIAHSAVSPSILQYVFAPAVTEDNDPSCLEGLMESHYQIPSERVDFHLLKIGVPTAVLRTTGYGPNIFAVESFIDELAARARRDPYLFRRELLKDDRALKVLETVVEKSGWKRRAPRGVARGIAYAEAFRTHIAHVVELSVNRGLVRIHRITCAIDCGIALDPEICKNSIEGGRYGDWVRLSNQTFRSKTVARSRRTSTTSRFHGFMKRRRLKYTSSTAILKAWVVPVKSVRSPLSLQ
jgi:isoquinoline 1-oxidoreductase beta subunit